MPSVAVMAAFQLDEYVAADNLIAHAVLMYKFW